MFCFVGIQAKLVDWDVVLINKRCGGAGLNLQAAHIEVIFEVSWNPEVDRQVVGRVHRRGQTEDCIIYHLTYAATPDEEILQTQMEKKQGSAKVTGCYSGAIAEHEQLKKQTWEVRKAALQKVIEWRGSDEKLCSEAWNIPRGNLDKHKVESVDFLKVVSFTNLAEGISTRFTFVKIY